MWGDSAAAEESYISCSFQGVKKLTHIVGKQFDTFSSDSYRENLGFSNFHYQINTIDEPDQPSLILEDEGEFENGFGWKVVLMGYGYGIVYGMFMANLVFATRKPKWLVRLIEGECYGEKAQRTNVAATT